MKKIQPRSNDNTAEMKALMSMYHSGNPELREQAKILLFEKVRDFIWHLIKTEYPSFYSDEEIRKELFSACTVAFFENIGRFNPENGTLSTWMTYPMRHEIAEWISKNISNSTSYHTKHMNTVDAAIKRLAEQGKPMTPANIAFETGYSVKKVESTLARLEANKFQRYDSNEELENMLTAHLPSPEEAYLEAEARKVIGEALNCLPELDKDIIILYFGLDGADPRSYAAVAKKVGCSAPQVQTSIARSLRVLKGNNTLRIMFGKGAQTYRQKQLDSIEISLVTNENIASAYDCLDEDVVDISVKKDANDNVKVLLTF